MRLIFVLSDSQSKNCLGGFVETVAASETVRAFVPPPLPPEPAIDVLSLLERLSLAERALGRLDGITMLLPGQELFFYMYVRKEAVLSSQIEGTQSTLSDLFGSRPKLKLDSLLMISVKSPTMSTL